VDRLVNYYLFLYLLTFFTSKPAFEHQTKAADYLTKLTVDPDYKGGILADEIGLEKTGMIIVLFFCLIKEGFNVVMTVVTFI
jgi:hypothetical protein